MRHTTVGPHRDDIAMTLAEMPLRRTASQGQTKTFTTALRLAQYEFLREATGMRPLLLLDDIFDKLDARQVEIHHRHQPKASRRDRGPYGRRLQDVDGQ